MDPTDAWYFKTYMDAGEYGFGLTAMTLDPLNDCPRHARYMDGVFAAADGRPYVRENMICIFESYAGDIGWRHAESPITGMPVSNKLKYRVLGELCTVSFDGPDLLEGNLDDLVPIVLYGR